MRSKQDVCSGMYFVRRIGHIYYHVHCCLPESKSPIKMEMEMEIVITIMSMRHGVFCSVVKSLVTHCNPFVLSLLTYSMARPMQFMQQLYQINATLLAE